MQQHSTAYCQYFDLSFDWQKEKKKEKKKERLNL
jgi:hypothetical protein